MPAQRGLFTDPELFDLVDPDPEMAAELDDADPHLLEQEWSRKRRAYVAEHAFYGVNA